MDILLDNVETRVLGSLVEKEITTPEYYPLSLNALLNACNQKSNRDPFMNLDEDALRQALHLLEEKGLAGPASKDSRVTKYEHRLQEAFNFDRREIAILDVLLLRGPQTPGELRARAQRLHRFDDLNEVQSALQRLMNWEPPLVKMLPRQPGNKEARYAHLLSGDIFEPTPEGAREPPASGSSTENEGITQLQDDIARLQKDLADLRGEFVDFRKRFE